MITFQLPSGPKNLSPLFPGVAFDGVEEYYVELKNGGTSYVTTPHYYRLQCCDDLIVWLYFVNYSGGVDGIPFSLKAKESETKSTKWKQALSVPLKRHEGGWQRSGITQYTSYTMECSFFSEQEQEYLEELLSTPNAWVFAKGKQGLSDTYLPVIVSDGKFTTKKAEERYYYSLEITVTMSNEANLLRN